MHLSERPLFDSSDRLTVVVTGSTGGIGSALCDELARLGWSLILVNRSQSKALEQKSTLLTNHPDLSITLVQADLMDLADIRRACRELLDKVSKIDALYCMAGVLTSQRRLSADGHESHYAVNVLANYVMIQELAPLMVSEQGQPPSMVVTMSSSAIDRGNLDIENLSDPPKIGGLMGAYAQSKLALTAMCAEMAEDLRSHGMLIRAIDPGPTKTPMTASGDGMPAVLRWIAKFMFADPHEQAQRIVGAANPDEFDGQSGILVSSWKQKPLPKSIVSPSIQARLLERIRDDCDSQVEQLR